jgi:16S rRNA A1518/A1519 N6-dimethyltransferase RsmA/KsgA/DIM1 with predicted DNA glycosylase/AP lyase activity
MKRLHTYSQNFLRSPSLVKSLVAISDISAGDTVYDIGAGSGVITSVLADVAKNVVAVEYEPRVAEKLRSNVRELDNVTVIEQDALETKFPTTPYVVFANIPFHLSSKILRKLTESSHPPRAIYLIVQKQFAEKLVPSPKHFTAQLGMMIGPLFEAKIKKRLRRTDFWPHPNVDTVFFELKLRDKPLLPIKDMSSYRKFTELCFSTPAKFARTANHRTHLPENIKPSQMTLEQWVELYLDSTK